MIFPRVHLLSLRSIFQNLGLLIFCFMFYQHTHEMISGGSCQKHKDPAKENLNCAISKTKSKLVKFLSLKKMLRIFYLVRL